MAGVSANVCEGVKSYWKRRGYQRLNGRGRRGKARVVLGQTGSSTTTTTTTKKRRRSFWKIQITPRLKLIRRFSPKKFFIGLRDAYVRMMMRVANTSVVHSGGGAVVYGGDSAFGLRPAKEYDEKMIIEIYKSLAVAQGLVPRDPAKIATAQISCAR